jgi:hypothetical protein
LVTLYGPAEVYRGARVVALLPRLVQPVLAGQDPPALPQAMHERVGLVDVDRHSGLMIAKTTASAISITPSAVIGSTSVITEHQPDKTIQRHPGDDREQQRSETDQIDIVQCAHASTPEVDMLRDIQRDDGADGGYARDHHEDADRLQAHFFGPSMIVRIVTLISSSPSLPVIGCADRPQPRLSSSAAALTRALSLSPFDAMPPSDLMAISV